MQTPWGPAQSQEQIASGIIEVDTAGHGGIKVSPPLTARIHKVWRTADGWYEEDCDWAIVALTFPQHFPEQRVERAHGCAKRWHAKSYAVAMGVEVREEVSVGDCPACGRRVQWHSGSTSFRCSGSDCDVKVPLRDVVLIHHPDGTTTTEEPDAEPEQGGPALLDFDMAAVASAVKQAMAAFGPRPNSEPVPAVGDLALTWMHDKPMIYGGPPDYAGSEQVKFGYGEDPEIFTTRDRIAPADTPLADPKDPRIKVSKGKRPGSWLPGDWALDLPERTTTWHKTKRDAIAAAVRRLAIVDWHAAQATATPASEPAPALAGVGR